MYPMGDEAMDMRLGVLLAKLDGGVGTVQLKRGRKGRVHQIFKRDFWTKPRTVKDLKNKLIAAFTGLGMETEDTK
jgi:hypothetical protein